MTAVCTLFEGDYHYGLGALVNSLYKNGFRGAIWAGYRGSLPFWATPISNEVNYKTYKIADDCEINFILLDTNYHLANYKPNFMLDLWTEYCPKIDRIVYFDPDIILKCEWNFISTWTSQHIALCEDLNSPIFAKEPERLNWQKVLSKHNIHLPLFLNEYINSGFIGLPKKHIKFLETWKEILSIINTEIRTLEASFIPQIKGNHYKIPPTKVFYRMDQDALNATAMLSSEHLSIASKQSMDFQKVGYVMSHAIGTNKPWEINYLKNFLDGRGVKSSHQEYWKNTEHPISLYPKSKLKIKKFIVSLTSFLSRFYLRKF